jgi:hypothetical protein
MNTEKKTPHYIVIYTDEQFKKSFKHKTADEID